jgi:hypothetical protein
MWWKFYVLMYENGTMRPVETVLRSRGGGINEKGGRGKSKIYCEYFYKCYHIPSYNYNMLKNK